MASNGIEDTTSVEFKPYKSNLQPVQGSELTISNDELCRITGLTIRRHTEIAKEGYIPGPIDGKWLLVATLSGLFKYYREHNQRTKEKLVNTKDEKTQKEILLLQLKIAKEERTVAKISEVESLHNHLATLLKTTLFQRLGRELGPKGEGKTAAELNVFGRSIAEELCGLFTNGIEQWKADEPQESET